MLHVSSPPDVVSIRDHNFTVPTAPVPDVPVTVLITAVPDICAYKSAKLILRLSKPT